MKMYRIKTGSKPQQTVFLYRDKCNTERIAKFVRAGLEAGEVVEEVEVEVFDIPILKDGKPDLSVEQMASHLEWEFNQFVASFRDGAVCGAKTMGEYINDIGIMVHGIRKRTR